MFFRVLGLNADGEKRYYAINAKSEAEAMRQAVATGAASKSLSAELISHEDSTTAIGSAMLTTQSNSGTGSPAIKLSRNVVIISVLAVALCVISIIAFSGGFKSGGQKLAVKDGRNKKAGQVILKLRKGEFFSLNDQEWEVAKTLAAKDITQYFGPPPMHGVIPAEQVHAQIQAGANAHFKLTQLGQQFSKALTDEQLASGNFLLPGE